MPRSTGSNRRLANMTLPRPAFTNDFGLRSAGRARQASQSKRNKTLTHVYLMTKINFFTIFFLKMFNDFKKSWSGNLS